MLKLARFWIAAPVLAGMLMGAKAAVWGGLECPDVPRDPTICSSEDVYMSCKDSGIAGDHRCFCNAAGLPSPCAEICRAVHLSINDVPECGRDCSEYLIRECRSISGGIVTDLQDGSISNPLLWIVLVAIIAFILAAIVIVYFCCCKLSVPRWCSQRQQPCYVRSIDPVEETLTSYPETRRITLWRLIYGWFDKTYIVDATHPNETNLFDSTH